MENITAKILQENEKISDKLYKNYIMKLRNCLFIFVLCEMTMKINGIKSLML